MRTCLQSKCVTTLIGAKLEVSRYNKKINAWLFEREEADLLNVILFYVVDPEISQVLELSEMFQISYIHQHLTAPTRGWRVKVILLEEGERQIYYYPPDCL